MTSVSIIIISFNTKDLISACIESLIHHYEKQFSSYEFELIIVDNNSTDRSRFYLEKIKNVYKNILYTLVLNKENEGFAKACNQAVQKARGKYVVFLNSDTTIRDNSLNKMINFLQKNETIGVVGGKLQNEQGKIEKSAGTFYHLLPALFMLCGLERFGFNRIASEKAMKVDWVSGGYMLVRKEIFNYVHGFDLHFFMYLEDMELCYRISSRGYSVYYYPDSSIIHKEQGSSSRQFAIVSIYKGLIYFYKKNKNPLEYSILRVMLILKAYGACIIGKITHNTRVTNTYRDILENTL